MYFLVVSSEILDVEFLERETETETESFLLSILFSSLANLQSSVVKISLFCSTLNFLIKNCGFLESFSDHL